MSQTQTPAARTNRIVDLRADRPRPAYLGALVPCVTKAYDLADLATDNVVLVDGLRASLDTVYVAIEAQRLLPVGLVNGSVLALPDDMNRDLANNDLGTLLCYGSYLYKREDIIMILEDNRRGLSIVSPDSEDVNDIPPVPAEDWFTENVRPKSSRLQRLTSRLTFRRNRQPKDQMSFATHLDHKLRLNAQNLLWALCAIPAFCALMAAIITDQYIVTIFDHMKLAFTLDNMVFAHSASVSLAFVITGSIAVLGAMMTVRYFTHRALCTVDGTTYHDLPVATMPASSRMRLVAFGCGIMLSYGLTLVVTTVVAAMMSH